MASHTNTPSTSTADLTSVALALFDQAISLLRSTITSSATLAHPSSLIPGSTIGKHLRHSHDHFRLLLDAIPPTSPGQDRLVMTVNYDARQRNVAMENSHEACLREFERLRERMVRETRGIELERQVRLEAVTPHACEFGTTFGRELWFACLHAIHHYSLLRVIITGELHLSAPTDFGVAPSTLAFRQFGQEASKSSSSPSSSSGSAAGAGSREIQHVQEASAGGNSGPAARL